MPRNTASLPRPARQATASPARAISGVTQPMKTKRSTPFPFERVTKSVSVAE